MPRKETKPDPERQLMIKTKACQRLIKDVAYYEQEVIENETQLQKMKDENRDPYDIKKFQEVLAESHMMIPDSTCRRDKALEDLKEYVSTVEKDEEVAGDFEWLVEAKNILRESGKDVASGGVDEVEKEEDVAVTAVDDLAEGEAF